MRVLDAASGDLLLHAIRTRETGSYYAIRTSADLPGEYAEDLRAVFAAEDSGEVAAVAPASLERHHVARAAD